ncbi:hypothetical protein [Ammoniphilus sp. CFH 90114]|uniref:hypothetical protein n=1 Tax=Ammoniphilus sp. CFH 90114 TaxID=2493665 RepID=UPI00100DD133|nr:hypothetical protein [Ammoniphilus sp. CFH 90114]RXT15326.1 hypothetical protein EIZ39_03735 [Ammoniphilus sp. CFH 90114]
MRISRAQIALLWSLTFPGFGQIYNRQVIKGFTLIGLEFLINLQGGINRAILYSFHGQFAPASQSVDWNWLLFYPCIYIFAAGEAFHQATLQDHKEYPKKALVPFILAAMGGTIGAIYGYQFGFGPIFNGLIGMAIGALIGQFLSKRILVDL